MALPADFSKIFASTATGGITPPSDLNYAKGWEWIGANSPEKNDFNYLQNLSDLKAQWLYNYIVTASNAASRTVGAGTNQIPDMSSFARTLSGNGKMRLPGGLLMQWGNAAPSPGAGSLTVTYNEAFASKPWYVGMSFRQADFPNSMQSIVINDSASDNTKFVARTLKFDGTSMTASDSAFNWFALGV